MSVYSLPPLAGADQVLIGWSALRESYVLDVAHHQDLRGLGPERVWGLQLGAAPDTITDPRVVLREAQTWAQVPTELEAQLRADAAAGRPARPADLHPRMAWLYEPGPLFDPGDAIETYRGPFEQWTDEPAEGQVYHLPHRPGRSPTDTYVGWDAEQGSYVARVIGYADRGEGIEDVDLLRAGHRDDPLTDPRQVIQAVERYAVIPGDLLDRLAADRRQPGGPAGPGPMLDGRTVVFLDAAEASPPVRAAAARHAAAAGFPPLHQVRSGPTPALGGVPQSPAAHQTGHRAR